MTGPQPPLLEAIAVGKDFGSVRAVGAVSIGIRAGEVVALAGENGSGKSTLARILAGSIRPDRGSLLVGGEPAQFTRPRSALDAGISLVTQEPSVVPALTVADNVMLHRIGRGARVVRRRNVEQQAERALALVGADIDPARPFESLAPGERELVELAKALASDPRVLILDEVTTRLPDPERLFEAIDRLCRTTEIGVVLITHRLREIRRLAHRAVVLRDGELVAELGRDDLSDERLSAAMVGRELSDLYAKPTVAVGEPVLEVVDLVTHRCGQPASFAVGRGEIVGVAGIAGCGRTELLEAIAGARRRSHGRVRVGGEPVSTRSPARAMAAGIGFVPDDRWSQALLADQSIVANLALASHRSWRRTDRRRDRDRAHVAIERLHIRASSIDAPVSSLSGGNAQKVVLARALALEPRVLLLSEPTRGVDIGAKAEIYQIIDELVARGIAVVISSSDLLELLGLCDRILAMHDGEVVGELSRAVATEEAITVLCGGGHRAA